MVATNAQICPTIVAFSCTNALKCLLLHKLLGPRVVCLQQMCKSVPLLIVFSCTNALRNAYSTTSFGGLEWFVCNKCTNSVPLVAFRCTEMPTPPHALVVWSGLVATNTQICPTVAFSCTNALKCLLLHLSFWDLEWFVCNKCTNLSHCCFQKKQIH